MLVRQKNEVLAYQFKENHSIEDLPFWLIINNNYANEFIAGDAKSKFSFGKILDCTGIIFYKDNSIDKAEYQKYVDRGKYINVLYTAIGIVYPNNYILLHLNHIAMTHTEHGNTTSIGKLEIITENDFNNKYEILNAKQL